MNRNAHALHHRAWSATLFLALIGFLTGCGGGGTAQTVEAQTTLSPQAALGRQMFFDVALSRSGQQSCGTCHVPSRAFTADPATDHGLPVALGGASMNLSGLRNTPTLMYITYTPAFHFEADGTPVGGMFRDGRASSLATQATMPFTTPFEMANADAAAVVAKLKARPYASQFEQIYGAAALNDPATALARMGAAIAAYESEDPSFHPFSSKVDAWQKGQATLSAQELKGLSVFNSPTQGNCAACHVSTSANGVTPPLFTDFSYDNLGLPRNAAIPANADPTSLPYVPRNGNDGVHAYYDLGLCGPVRTDLAYRTDLCGAFKVPTLRNIALTAPYFHNGVFSTLQDAVGFYARRDTNPEQWYPAGAAPARYTKFNDLPAAYGGNFVIDTNVAGSDLGHLSNVNTSEIPYNRHIGQQPAISADDIQSIVAFLCTLTDGYDPLHPDTYNAALPSQCPQSTAATTASTAASH